jgi:SAM-dependent methyltransferase
MKLDHRYDYWEKNNARDTYFACKGDYVGDIRQRYYGEFSGADEMLTSMGLVPGAWGKKYNNTKGFRDLKKDGKNWDVLEIGCGYGGFGAMIAPFVKRYFGVDISSHTINKGKEAIKECGIDNMYLTAVPDSDLLIFPDELFDMIYTTALFIHTERDVTEHYLRETRRLLKDDGFFIHHMNVTDGEPINAHVTKCYHTVDCDSMFSEAGLIVTEKRDGVDYKPGRFMRYSCGVKDAS